MIFGVVGAEAAKFTVETEMRAKGKLAKLYMTENPKLVISGACHLGGVDIWAIEVAQDMGFAIREYPPRSHQWEPNGYKQRNLLIAENADMLVCIAVQEYPPRFMGRRFGHCYHHSPPATDHIKGGGCWTLRQAEKLGKKTQLVIV